MLVGFALSRNVGSAHYAYAYAYDDGIRHLREGTLDIGTTAVHAYLRRPVTADSAGYWGIAGFGGGTATDTPAGGDAEAGDLTLLMGAVGLRGVLESTAEPLAAAAAGGDGPDSASPPDTAGARRRGELALYGDLGVAVLATGPGDRAIDSLHVPVLRARAGTEISETRPVGTDGALTGSLELWSGWDGGTGAAGAGLGTALALRYAGPRFTAEARGNLLLASDYLEYGAGFTGRYGPRYDGAGLSLSFAPSWGSSTGAPNDVWPDDPLAGAAAPPARRWPPASVTASPCPAAS